MYPQLLAVVVIILTRPDPQRLFWACYLTCLVVSVGSGVVIFAVFRSRETIAGASSSRVGAWTYLAVGVLGVLIGAFMATSQGRALVDRLGSARRRHRSSTSDSSSAAARVRRRAEGALSEGSLVVAALVGALLAIPGPFDLLAVGRLARGGYAAIAAVAVIVGFALLKFVLIEVPIVGYTLDPSATAAKVTRFSNWMQANKLAGTGAVVAVIGVVLIGQGISSLT